MRGGGVAGAAHEKGTGAASPCSTCWQPHHVGLARLGEGGARHAGGKAEAARAAGAREEGGAQPWERERGEETWMAMELSSE
jgi:hypothetical protein